MACAITLYACAQGIDTPIDPTGGSGGGASSTTGNPPTSGTGFSSTVGSGASSATSTGTVGSASTTAGVGGAAGSPSGSGGTATVVGAGGSAGATAGGGNAGTGGSAGSGGSAGNGGNAGTGGSAGNGGAGGAGGQPPLRPTGVTLGGSTPSGQRAPSTGGSAFTQGCMPNEVIIGYTGTVDAPGAATNYLRSFRAVCGSLSVSGTTAFLVNTTAAETLPVIGATPGVTPQTRMCAPNTMVVGYGGRSGLYIDQLAFICAPLDISGTSPSFTVSVGSKTTLTGLGGPGGSAFTAISCPTGRVAIGNEGRSGLAIDAFGLLCATPSLVVQ